MKLGSNPNQITPQEFTSQAKTTTQRTKTKIKEQDVGFICFTPEERIKGDCSMPLSQIWKPNYLKCTENTDNGVKNIN